MFQTTYCKLSASSVLQESYNVDVWSGNHPFFQGNQSTVLVDEGRVNRFNRRYAGGLPLSWPILFVLRYIEGGKV